MHARPIDDRPRRIERAAYVLLWLLLLTPVLAHGLWRPLVHVFGSAARAPTMTLAAVVIGAAVAAVQALRPRGSVLLSLSAGCLGAGVATLAGSLGIAGFLTLLVVAGFAAFLTPRLYAGVPATLDGLAGRHRILCACYVILALVALVKTTHLCTFMGDPTRSDLQVLPGEKFMETHSCLSAYVHADKLSRQRVDNLYAEPLWLGSQGLPEVPAGAENPYRPFLLDYYAYPPPFLLAMTPLAPFSGDFAAQRALWFGLNGLLLALGLWVVARWVDGPKAHRILLLAPLFFGALPVLATLQVGNFQIAVVVMTILAMVSFDQNRSAIGGALLAFAILSKLSPGVFGIVLLLQRRYRSAAWTAGFGLLFLAISVAMAGMNPLHSFLTYTLPRLSSGVTFAFLDDTPFNIFTNMAPFGLPFKFQLAGMTVHDPWRLARRVSRVYSGVLVLLALVAARRRAGRRPQAVVWMSLGVLAALQSPFAPGYVTIGLLWAIALMSVEVRSVLGGFGLLLLWLSLTVVPPTPNLQMYAVFTILQSAVTLAAPIWLVCRPAPTSA